MPALWMGEKHLKFGAGDNKVSLAIAAVGLCLRDSGSIRT